MCLCSSPNTKGRTQKMLVKNDRRKKDTEEMMTISKEVVTMTEKEITMTKERTDNADEEMTNMMPKGAVSLRDKDMTVTDREKTMIEKIMTKDKMMTAIIEEDTMMVIDVEIVRAIETTMRDNEGEVTIEGKTMGVIDIAMIMMTEDEMGMIQGTMRVIEKEEAMSVIMTDEVAGIKETLRVISIEMIRTDEEMVVRIEETMRVKDIEMIMTEEKVTMIEDETMRVIEMTMIDHEVVVMTKEETMWVIDIEMIMTAEEMVDMTEEETMIVTDKEMVMMDDEMVDMIKEETVAMLEMIMTDQVTSDMMVTAGIMSHMINEKTVTMTHKERADEEMTMTNNFSRTRDDRQCRQTIIKKDEKTMTVEDLIEVSTTDVVNMIANMFTIGIMSKLHPKQAPFQNLPHTWIASSTNVLLSAVLVFYTHSTLSISTTSAKQAPPQETSSQQAGHQHAHQDFNNPLKAASCKTFPLGVPG